MYQNFEDPDRNILKRHLHASAQITLIGLTSLLYVAALITIDPKQFFDYFAGTLLLTCVGLLSTFIVFLLFYLFGRVLFVLEIIFSIFSIILVFSWSSHYPFPTMFAANTLVTIFGANLLYQLLYKEGFIFSTFKKGLNSTKGTLKKFAWFVALQRFKIDLILRLTSVPFFFINLSGFTGTTRVFLLLVLIVSVIVWCLLVTYFFLISKNSLFYVSAAFFYRQKKVEGESKKKRRKRALKEAKEALENNYATIIEATAVEIKSLLKGFALPLSHTLARSAVWGLSHEEALERTILTKNRISGRKFVTWNAVFQVLVSCSVISSVVAASYYVLDYQLIDEMALENKSLAILKRNFTNFPIVFFVEVFSQIVFYAFLGGLTVSQVVVGLDNRELGLEMNENVVRKLDAVDKNTETNNRFVEDQYERYTENN